MNAFADSHFESNDAYPHLRQVLAPELALLPGAHLQAYMAEQFGEGAAEHYDEMLEGIFDDVGRALSKAAPVVANVAGGVARGAMSGSALGLPGIIGGAVLGGAGTAMSSYGKGPLRQAGNMMNMGVNTVGQFTPMGRAGQAVGATVSGLARGGFRPAAFARQGRQLLGSALGSVTGGAAGGGGAAGQALGGLLGSGGAASSLASVIGRPEVRQALMALQLGNAGRRTVPVGNAGTPVPTTAIAGLLQNLAGSAVAEAAAESDGAESALEYMADGYGEFVGDPALEQDRSQRVLDLLNHAQLERLDVAAHRHTAQAMRARQPRDCPRCGVDLRRHATQECSGAEAADEAWDERWDERWDEDFGELDMELDAESDGEDYGEDLSEDLGEDLGEDVGASLSGLVAGHAEWELPHGYA